MPLAGAGGRHHTVVVTKDGSSFAFGSNKEVSMAMSDWRSSVQHSCQSNLCKVCMVAENVATFAGAMWYR